MGAEQSKPGEDQVFSNPGVNIQFSEDLVNKLEDDSTSPNPSSERQSTLDNHVRARIQAELSRLREEEESVRAQIEAALEKENLDKEKALAGHSDSEAEGENVSSSAALQGDLEEVQKRVERFNARRQLSEYPEVKAAQDAVVECYKSNSATPLDCVESVEQFKHAVESMEKKFVGSLQ